MRREALIGKAVAGRLLAEGGHAVRVQTLRTLIDEQLVGATFARDRAGVADVDVQPAVAVDVREGDAGCPGPVPLDAGFGGDVAEAEVALVEIEPVAALVGGDHELREAITVQVADRDPTAVVVIAVGEDVQVGGGGEAILEVDAGVAGGQQREQSASGRGGLTRERRTVPTRAPGEQAGGGHQEPTRLLPEAT